MRGANFGQPDAREKSNLLPACVPWLAPALNLLRHVAISGLDSTGWREENIMAAEDAQEPLLGLKSPSVYPRAAHTVDRAVRPRL